MKVLILCILVSFLASMVMAQSEGNLMIRLKTRKDETKLTLVSLMKSSEISEFIPLISEIRAAKASVQDTQSKSFQQLLRYYEVVPTEQFIAGQKTGKSSLKSLQEELLKNHSEFIDACYISPINQLPVMEMYKTDKNSKSNTPSFVDRQHYLEASPRGVGQEFAINRPGGNGKGMKVVDIEGGWDLDHEDFAQEKPRLIYGVHSAQTGWLDHGTAVMGEISGDQNNFGVTGIAPKTSLFGASIYTTPTRQGSAARAFIAAADFLKAGDIMLIELHRIGPTGKFLPMEWWPDNYAALKYATDKGVIVIEAGGNGNQNLDDPRLNIPSAGFPRDWVNPLNRTLADSGCVLVGAGAPPSGAFGPNHCRLDFSNYGNSVDVQGYGREVVTTGYGDLQRGTRQTYYTARFSGTSSASPIVVGAVAALQGVSTSEFGVTLTPGDIRKLLRSSGVPQKPCSGTRPVSERIGSFPNLKELINNLRSYLIEKQE